MRTNVGYAQLIPMVQGVLDTLDSGIEAEQDAAAGLGNLARAMGNGQSEGEKALLQASRQHAIKAMQMRAKRAALLTQYGLS
ncbi:hypothetical protein [Methylobacterium sp. E-045]|uniref:hypothetical protein n=1 Tax=Methylobacterium sp. E-045 TaxID=2836575 RepID=UPI001FB8D0C7|nr:hypothetical protein [Methylobacterium sp. E-045]MCJ2129349.1 hypothetical protein [Methylobacterium sp. E-045]